MVMNFIPVLLYCKECLEFTLGLERNARVGAPVNHAFGSTCSFVLLLSHCLSHAINRSIADYVPLVNQPCHNLATDPLLHIFMPVNQSLHPRKESYVNTHLTTVITNEQKNWISDGSARIQPLCAQ